MCMLHIYRYVEVDEVNGVHLFYYFVRSERERSPGDDPVVLWLTGGPGCSVLTALAYEIGMYGCMLCYCHSANNHAVCQHNSSFLNSSHESTHVLQVSHIFFSS